MKNYIKNANEDEIVGIVYIVAGIIIIFSLFVANLLVN